MVAGPAGGASGGAAGIWGAVGWGGVRAECSRRAISAVRGCGSQPVKSPMPRPADSWQSAASSSVPMRSVGSAVRQRSSRGRSRSSYPSSFGGRWAVLAICAAMVMAPPSPYGWRPVAATAAIRPSEKTSVAGVTGSPRACSGDMYCGVPIRPPDCVRWVASAARAMPKSMTYGPCEPSRMLLGLRSRWMTPAAWMEVRARAAQPTSWKTAGRGSGPKATRASCRGMPAMNADASQGSSPVVSWSTTGTMW